MGGIRQIVRVAIYFSKMYLCGPYCCTCGNAIRVVCDKCGQEESSDGSVASTALTLHCPSIGVASYFASSPSPKDIQQMTDGYRIPMVFIFHHAYESCAVFTPFASPTGVPKNVVVQFLSDMKPRLPAFCITPKGFAKVRIARHYVEKIGSICKLARHVKYT